MKKSKPQIRMIVVQDVDGFSAFATVGDQFIAAMGATFDGFLDNLVEAVNFAFEEEGIAYELHEINLVASQQDGVSLTDAYKDFVHAVG